MDLLYIVSAKQHLALRAQSILLHRGCHTRSLVGEEKIADLVVNRQTAHLVSVFVAQEKYLGPHLSILQPGEETCGGILIPQWAKDTDTKVALQFPSENVEDTVLSTAILNMHKILHERFYHAPVPGTTVLSSQTQHRKRHGTFVHY